MSFAIVTQKNTLKTRISEVLLQAEQCLGDLFCSVYSALLCFVCFCFLFFRGGSIVPWLLASPRCEQIDCRFHFFPQGCADSPRNMTVITEPREAMVFVGDCPGKWKIPYSLIFNNLSSQCLIEFYRKVEVRLCVSWAMTATRARVSGKLGFRFRQSWTWKIHP